MDVDLQKLIRKLEGNSQGQEESWMLPYDIYKQNV